MVKTFDRLSVRERRFRKYLWQCYGHRGENVGGLSRSGQIATTAMIKEKNSTEIDSFFTLIVQRETHRITCLYSPLNGKENHCK